MDYMEKIFKNTDLNKSIRISKENNNKETEYCSKFEKGKDGFCINYTGDKENKESCAKKCFINAFNY